MVTLHLGFYSLRRASYVVIVNALNIRCAYWCTGVGSSGLNVELIYGDRLGRIAFAPQREKAERWEVVFAPRTASILQKRRDSSVTQYKFSVTSSHA